MATWSRCDNDCVRSWTVCRMRFQSVAMITSPFLGVGLSGFLSRACDGGRRHCNGHQRSAMTNIAMLAVDFWFIAVHLDLDVAFDFHGNDIDTARERELECGTTFVAATTSNGLAGESLQTVLTSDWRGRHGQKEQCGHKEGRITPRVLTVEPNVMVDLRSRNGWERA